MDLDKINLDRAMRICEIFGDGYSLAQAFKVVDILEEV